MNPSILYFSRMSAVWKALLFLAASAVLAYVAYAMQQDAVRAGAPLAEPGAGREIEGANPAGDVRAGPMIFPLPGPRSDPLAAIKISLLFVGAALGLFYVGRYARRAAMRGVAARLENRSLLFHSSYWGVPGAIALGDITMLLFDRADRLPETESASWLKALSSGGYWGARQGARMRYMLHVAYRAGGEVKSIRLVDNDIEGGAEQLERFAAYIEAHRAGLQR